MLSFAEAAVDPRLTDNCRRFCRGKIAAEASSKREFT